MRNLGLADIDWWAVDSVGNLGHFANCVKGAIPVFYLRNQKLLETWHDVLHNLYLPKHEATLTSIAYERKSRHRQIDFSDYLDWAARGFFSFDFAHEDECDHETSMRGTSGTFNYYLICRPEVPLTLSALPPDVRDNIPRLTEFSIQFNNSDWVRLAAGFASIDFDQFE